MLLPRQQDIIHKIWLLRLLTDIADDKFLSAKMAFKGGTCAAMRGYLNRFSVDLDFDFLGVTEELPSVSASLEKIFKKRGLTIKDQSKKAPQYFLKYPTKDPDQRNSLNIDVNFPTPKSNQYEKILLPEIDRVMISQTKETMMANKLLAIMDRYERHQKVAGRDIYDTYHFFLQGFSYDPSVIREDFKGSLKEFFTKLISFIEVHISQLVIDQDLNFLLPNEDFQRIRKTLKAETLMLLRIELGRRQFEIMV
jgi:predicted nucleotidyltransferase component of viral defense system